MTPTPSPFAQELQQLRADRATAAWQADKFEVTHLAVRTLSAYHRLTGQTTASAQGVSYSYKTRLHGNTHHCLSAILRDPTDTHNLTLSVQNNQNEPVVFTHPADPYQTITSRADLADLHNEGPQKVRLKGQAHANISYSPPLILDAQTYQELRSSLLQNGPYVIPALLTASPLISALILLSRDVYFMMAVSVATLCGLVMAWASDDEQKVYTGVLARETLHLHDPEHFPAVHATPRPWLLTLSGLTSVTSLALAAADMLNPLLITALLIATPILAWQYLHPARTAAAVRAARRSAAFTTPTGAGGHAQPPESHGLRVLRERAQTARAEVQAGQPYTQERHRHIHAYETEWPASQAAVNALPQPERAAALEQHVALLLRVSDSEPLPATRAAHTAQLRHLDALKGPRHD